MEEKRNVFIDAIEEWLECSWQEGLIEFLGTLLFFIGGYICTILILMIA